MSEEAGSGDPDVYVYDPRDVSLAAHEAETAHPLSILAEDMTDQTHFFAHEGRQLVYHSAPFERDMEISGFFKLIAWLSIDQPDTDFRVAVYEIGRKGDSVLLTYDMRRARYRESLREEKLIETGEPLQYVFDGFTFISRLIRRGSRLRLTLGPVNSIYYQKNYNSGGCVSDKAMKDARSVTVKLFHDAQRPSALHVPFGHPGIELE